MDLIDKHFLLYEIDFHGFVLLYLFIFMFFFSLIWFLEGYKFANFAKQELLLRLQNLH